MQRFLQLFLLLLLFCPEARGEGDTTAIRENSLYLNIRNLNFIRNNEYSNPVTEGYTLIGYFIQPELVYAPSENIILRLGTHLLSYSGAGKFSKVKPIFSTVWNISEKAQLRAGSLAGSESHKMSDPHFSNERVYTDNSEDGLQFTWQNANIFSDSWLSWENYISRGDSTREIFTAGESFKYSSSLIANTFRFELPLQVQFKHYGGQISNYPEKVETFFNLAAGARISADLSGMKYGQAGFEYLLFTGRKLTGKSPGQISYGYAEWYKVFYNLKSFSFTAGYWTSHDFFAPNGNYIFGSVSDFQDVKISDRTIFTFSGAFSMHPGRWFDVYLGLEGFYDKSFRRFDNAIMLHLRFEKLISLCRTN